MRLSNGSKASSRRYLLTTFFCCILAMNSEGQRPLSIGDQVPDIFFQHMLNYKSKTARLSDFKSKLVILDMWSVNCTSCIAGFPKMDALQKEFADKIQILLTNPHDPKYDSESKIRSTLEKQKVRTGFQTSLPIPVHDSILNSLFPHKSVPHIVVIDRTGKLLQVTSPTFLTRDTIQSILNGSSVHLPFKNDWEFENPMTRAEKETPEDNNVLYRSQFTRFTLGKPSIRTIVTPNNEVIGYQLNNHSLQQLIAKAYRDSIGGISWSRTILDVKNPDQYILNANYRYRYCYELAISPRPRKLFRVDQYLQEDLRRFFNIAVYKKKQETDVLVVSSNSDFKDLSAKHDTVNIDLEETTIKKYLHNYSIEEAIRILESYIKIPLLNETRSNIRIDLDFPDNFDLSDKAALLKWLASKGFVFEQKRASIGFVVISDK